MTPQIALQNLYQASMLAKLTAEEHKILAECVVILDNIINPKTSTKNK